MRRAILLMLVCASMLWCQSGATPEDKTMGSYNGVYWTRCPTAVKAGIVVGFDIAMGRMVVPDEVGKKFAISGTVGDSVRALDEYYGRSTGDLRTPIWLAIRIVKMERDGLTSAEVAARLEEEGIWSRVTPASK